MLDPQTALIYTMVLVSASDRQMSDLELHTLGENVKNLPVFRGFDGNKLVATARRCATSVRGPDGLNHTLDLIYASLPEHLRETAYALACDVVASDNHGSPEELRVLEQLRHRIGLGKLVAAAIERGARARYRRP
jgi:tellurite resistance protein